MNVALTDGAAITAQFGDEGRDQAHRQTLSETSPDREVVQFTVNRLPEGGGVIYCVTQHSARASFMAGWDHR